MTPLVLTPLVRNQGSCMTVTFGLMNLILAVIIQRAQEAREGDQALKAQETLFVRDSAKIRLMKLCAIMDEDGSGNLTREELVGAYALDEE